MATIIDQLFITLGLKTDGFEKGAKKATDSLKKVDDASEKTQKNVQLNAKKTSDSFENAFESLSRFGAALVSIGAAKQFIQSQVETHAQIGRTSQLLNINVKDLDAWDKAAQSTGASAGSFTQSIQGVYEELAKIPLGGGQAAQVALARLGVEAKNGRVDLNELATAVKKFRDQYGELTAKSVVESLGFNQEGYLLLTKNQEELEKLVDSMKKLSGASDQNSESARKLESAWAGFKQVISGIAGDEFARLVPLLEGMLSIITKISEKYRELNKKGNTNLLLDIVTGGTAGKLQKFLNFALSKPEDKNKTMRSGQIKGLKQEEESDTSDYRGQKNLPRGVRNNNPGNLEYGAFARAHGAVDSDGRFAIFPDMQTGKNAMRELLQKNYLDKGYDTLRKVLYKYAPPTDRNDTEGYIDQVSKRTGIGANQQLTSADLAKISNAMIISEGNKMALKNDFKKTLPNLNETLPPVGAANYDALNKGSGGNVTNSTNIQNVNVYTQATDALGVANGMRDALAKQQLINYGVAGAR